MFDVPCELDNEIGSMKAFTPVTELPALEEMHLADERQFDDRRRFDDRQRPYTRRPFAHDGSYRRQTPPFPRRQNQSFGPSRFSDSSYWKHQSSRRRRDSLWEADED